MAIKKVVFKNEIDRATFIGIQFGYLSLPGISFELAKHQNGNPMLVVDDTLADIADYKQLTAIVDYKIYRDSEFRFNYIKCINGKLLVDFMDGEL